MPKKKPAALAVHVLLDRSGSMQSVKDDTIGAFNNYIETLAKEAPDSTLSLTIFDSQGIDTVVKGEKIGDVKPLTAETYQPRSSTPLLDAVGKAATMLAEQKGKNKALIIITDGQENASREYKLADIKALVKERQEKDNWLISFLGADMDAFGEAGGLGIAVGTTVALKKSKRAFANMGSNLAASTMRYASSGDLTAAAYTDDERASMSVDD